MCAKLRYHRLEALLQYPPTWTLSENQRSLEPRSILSQGRRRTAASAIVVLTHMQTSGSLAGLHTNGGPLCEPASLALGSICLKVGGGKRRQLVDPQQQLDEAKPYMVAPVYRC